MCVFIYRRNIKVQSDEKVGVALDVVPEPKGGDDLAREFGHIRAFDGPVLAHLFKLLEHFAQLVEVPVRYRAVDRGRHLGGEPYPDGFDRASVPLKVCSDVWRAFLHVPRLYGSYLPDLGPLDN